MYKYIPIANIRRNYSMAPAQRKFFALSEEGMSVKRYNMISDKPGTYVVCAEQEGSFVAYTDYAALETERDQLRAELEAARAEVERLSSVLSQPQFCKHEFKASDDGYTSTCIHCGVGVCKPRFDWHQNKHPGAGT